MTLCWRWRSHFEIKGQNFVFFIPCPGHNFTRYCCIFWYLKDMFTLICRCVKYRIHDSMSRSHLEVKGNNFVIYILSRPLLHKLWSYVYETLQKCSFWWVDMSHIKPMTLCQRSYLEVKGKTMIIHNLFGRGQRSKIDLL